jgi:hypothetical protein
MSALQTILMLTLLLFTITVDASAQCFTDKKQGVTYNLESTKTIEFENKVELNDNDEQSLTTYQATFYHSLTIKPTATQTEFIATKTRFIIRAPPAQA